ncbi:MAG: SagB/ThcOx family dehydrogenase [bacterium]
MSVKAVATIALVVIFAGLALAEETINLPTPQSTGRTSVEESLYRRRSVRTYAKTELSAEQLSQLLWAAQGVTDRELDFRTAPSAGAIYPLTIYVAKKNGVFIYAPKQHQLIEHLKEDIRPSLMRASLGQDSVREAPVCLIITARSFLTTEKYGARAFRYICLETGHVAENIHLQAITLGLSSIPIGSFWDDVVAKTLDLPADEYPIYIIPVGYQGQ